MTIEKIDCETFKIDISQRKNLLHAVRGLFAGPGFTEWKRESSDADLFVFGRAKYNSRPIDDAHSREEALKDYEAWVLLAKVPYYICSYYKEYLRNRLAQAA
ncbi:MAG: hypothetical protein V4644_01510 [Patescibacteria group bacterium]